MPRLALRDYLLIISVVAAYVLIVEDESRHLNQFCSSAYIVIRDQAINLLGYDNALIAWNFYLQSIEPRLNSISHFLEPNDESKSDGNEAQSQHQPLDTISESISSEEIKEAIYIHKAEERSSNIATTFESSTPSAAIVPSALTTNVKAAEEEILHFLSTPNLKLNASVCWMAPFFSGGGYSSEAIAFAEALHGSHKVNLKIAQHGDAFNSDFVAGLSSKTQKLLHMLTFTPADITKSIFICHSEPGAWNPPLYMTSLCPPDELPNVQRRINDVPVKRPTSPKAMYKIGRTMFETDRINREWVNRCSKMDEIWVPTNFHIQTFSEAGLDRRKLVRIPEPVDLEFFDPEKYQPYDLPVGRLAVGQKIRHPDETLHLTPSTAAPNVQNYDSSEKFTASTSFVSSTASIHPATLEEDVINLNPARAAENDTDEEENANDEGTEEELSKIGKSHFAFLSIFKWEERKAWDILIKSFLLEFSSSNDSGNVALYLLTNPYHGEHNFEEQIRKLVIETGSTELGSIALDKLPSIYLIDEHIPNSELPRLYKSMDAFVLPSRGEGWGRPHVEAMSMELPVIATNWSGPTEYLNEKNGYPLQVESLVEIKTGAYRGHRWAQPSLSHLRELMRRVVSNPVEAKQKGIQARQDMTAYSPEAVASIVLKRLYEIQQSLSVS